MFSDKGNALVRGALHGFLTHPEVVAASKALKAPKHRFAAFQDFEVKTRKGTTFFEYTLVLNKPEGRDAKSLPG